MQPDRRIQSHFDFCLLLFVDFFMKSGFFQTTARAGLVVFLASFACTAIGGTVYLQGDDVVHGTIVDLTDDALTVATDFAGDITIAMAKVEGITTSKSVAMKFESGDILHGELAFGPNGQQHIAQTEFGSMPVRLGHLKAIWPKGTPSPEEIRLRELRENRWSGSLRFGLSGSSGNDESMDVSLGAKAERKARKSRLYLKTFVDRGRDNGDMTTNQILGTIRMERDFSERFFAFGQVEAEREEFSNVDFRFSVSVGPGYYIIMQEHQNMKVRLGLGYEYVNPVDGNDVVSETIATLAYQYQVDLTESVSFSHDLSFVPRLSDKPLDNFRIKSVLGLEAALGNGTGWSLLAEYRQEYDSNPEPGLEDLDTSYVLNLVKSFE